MLDVQQLTFNKKITPNAIKAILQATALPLANTDELTQGTGRLNMLGALSVARRVNPWTPVGQIWLTSCHREHDLDRGPADHVGQPRRVGRPRRLGRRPRLQPGAVGQPRGLG